MWVSAFQTHSEVGVGEEWSWVAVGWVAPGALEEFWGLF